MHNIDFPQHPVWRHCVIWSMIPAAAFLWANGNQLNVQAGEQKGYVPMEVSWPTRANVITSRKPSTVEINKDLRTTMNNLASASVVRNIHVLGQLSKMPAISLRLYLFFERRGLLIANWHTSRTVVDSNSSVNHPKITLSKTCYVFLSLSKKRTVKDNQWNISSLHHIKDSSRGTVRYWISIVRVMDPNSWRKMSPWRRVGAARQHNASKTTVSHSYAVNRRLYGFRLIIEPVLIEQKPFWTMDEIITGLVR